MLTKPDGLGMWNENNLYLGNIKMYPLGWRPLVQEVYKLKCNGSPASDYMLTNMYVHRFELTAAYTGVPVIINKYVEKIFSDVYCMQVHGEKVTRLADTLSNDFPDKIIPLIRHHYSESAKNIF
jgi:hypothetical protein